MKHALTAAFTVAAALFASAPLASAQQAYPERPITVIVPEVPTVAEAGYPGYDAVGWGAIFVPNGIPQPIIDKLAATIAKVVARPEVKKQFEEQGTEPAASSQAEMAKILKDEYVRLGTLAKSLGLSVN